LIRSVSNTIVDKLDKIDNGILTKILYAVKNKPEAIALLKTSSKNPNVVDAIKYGDLTYLTNDIDKKIFNTLEFIDNDILKVLVDYYTHISQSDDVFRIDSRAESQFIGEEDVTKIDDASIIDSGINPPTDISKVEGDIIDVNELAAINAEAVIIYDRIKNKNNTKNVIDILNIYYNIFYNYRYDKKIFLNMQGKKLLINYMLNNNTNFKLSANPWKIINENMREFFNELEITKQNVEPTHLGTGIKSVKFLSSNPKVLMNKLKILLAERDAGNNNVFDEISAIADELRRTGVLSLRQFKNLYKNLH